MIGLGNDLRKFQAKQIGTDSGTDVALLKIDENNLPALNFADSDKARGDDVVLAIGNPFGLRQTVTMGIISAVGPAARHQHGDLHPQRWKQGIGFAIPANLASVVMQSLHEQRSRGARVHRHFGANSHSGNSGRDEAQRTTNRRACG